jgi:hypothetical protein
MDILILILVLVLILIFFNYNSSSTFKSTFSIREKLYNGDKWAKYRLGDVFVMEKNSKFYNPNFDENLLYHLTDFPDTIAYEYMKNNVSGVPRNTPLLQEIINKRRIKNDFTLFNRTLVLHIRVGDVLCKKTWKGSEGPDFYSKKGNKIWWENVVRYINDNDINTVIILAGTHFKECLEESADYIIDRSGFLMNKTGVNIEYRLGNSPDDDLLLVSNIKHFITTGGEYGNLLKTVKLK